MNELQVNASNAVLMVLAGRLNQPRVVNYDGIGKVVDEVRQAVDMLDRICPREMSGTAAGPDEADCPTPREMRRADGWATQGGYVMACGVDGANPVPVQYLGHTPPSRSTQCTLAHNASGPMCGRTTVNEDGKRRTFDWVDGGRGSDSHWQEVIA